MLKDVNKMTEYIMSTDGLDFLPAFSTDSGPSQPRKFITTKCNRRCAKMKSANALSWLIPLKRLLFSGFT